MVQPCDLIIELPNAHLDAEEVATTMKVDAKLIPLLEKAGINVQQNRRMPPPPAICEEWWGQAEEMIKKKCKVQPKFGLGYSKPYSSDSEDEDFDDDAEFQCYTLSVKAKDDIGCSYEIPKDSYASMITEQEGELEDPFMPDELKEEKQPTIDDLVEINLGTMDDPRPTFVSAALSAEEQESYRSFLMEYRDCFAWTYKEMPGLDPRVATHKLAIDPQFRPVKQPPRRLRPEFQDQVIAEVDRLITAGFIKEVQYPRWLANIVPVEKKNGQVRVCVDFRDLNRACPKDDFPIPITEMVVDSTTGYGALSFMDGSSGYNQIKMDPRDAIDTAFRTPKGNFYYTVMPFGLKNAGATYQ